MPIAHSRKGHRSLRRGRVSMPGQVYLVTTCTHQRLPIFKDFTLARQACTSFQDPSLLGDARMLAWVLMPDHVHWLIQLGNSFDLSELIKRLKSSSAYQVNQCLHQEAIWERAFHDRALRKEEGVIEAARYVIANPLRAGLVQNVGEYPFWNSAWL
ncbi:REP-associated tyrosine transposase [Microbulbifer zhoushanensis]